METASLPDKSPLSSVPAPLTPLVGRERELALAQALLQRPEVRLLTLTGPGGIGKTRLALEIVTQAGAAYADGARFVSLAAVADSTLVPATVARAAGIQDFGDAPIGSALTTALQHVEMLLVLDNFEHVVAAAPLLSDLLETCPRVKILVTSRVLLRLDGEHAIPVPPLRVGSRKSEVGSREVDAAQSEATHLHPPTSDLRPPSSPAVQLFAQRAAALSPSFLVTDDNAPLVAEICQRLDGVPLAIELAAARVTHLSLPKLRERLERRLPLLTGGGRDRPPRLQTMRNAIAWSHDLLSPAEQILFRRLAVFAGGFTLEAAEWIGGRRTEDGRSIAAEMSSSDSRLPTSDSFSDTLDLVGALIDASLLHADSDSSGMTRYWMLETIREFALERLRTSGDEELIRDRHAAAYSDFAARYELAELLPDGSQAIAQLEAEHANLRAALVWLEEREAAGAFLGLAASLGKFWCNQGHYQEGRGWLERALAQGDRTMTADRAKALVVLGLIEAYQGANREAVTHLTEGLPWCREQGDMLNVAMALIALGALALVQGDHERGAALLAESLTVARAMPEQRLGGMITASGLNNIAVIARARGDYPLATEQLEAALSLEREAGYTPGTIMNLGDLGDLARDQGDYARAMSCYREALELGRENPGIRVVADVIEAVGIVAIATGEAGRGARLLGAAEALRERIGLRYRVVENEQALAQAMATSLAVLGEAAFAAAWAAGRSLGPAQAVAEALDPAAPPARPPSALLTPREVEILQLLASGLTDPAIAAALYLSVRTVENHVARIFGKLGVRTRTAAVTAAIAAGLIAPSQPTTV